MMNSLTRNNYASAAPEVGMGATELLHSDRHAYTVIYLSANGKMIVLQGDKAVRTDDNGMSDAQSYEYTRNAAGRVIVAKLCKDGHWHVEGKLNNTVVMLGRRDEYYDYSF